MAVEADADALIIGAGPAGSASAILLARAGWRVILVEQHAFPRQKVCGECISAGSLAVLDELGVGDEFRRRAGPELRRVGWIGRRHTVEAEFPRCDEGADGYGRALGRDVLDAMLLAHARALGVEILQPAKVEQLQGGPGAFVCRIAAASGPGTRDIGIRRVGTVIDAHGSWEPGPTMVTDPAPWVPTTSQRIPKRRSDLFAFKASYERSGLADGLLPVFAFPGGYGGLVVAEQGRTTLACCIRRDALQACRATLPGVRAGDAVARHLRLTCRALHDVIDDAHIEGSWLAVGPIRPGVRVADRYDVFRVGNAAGETHPLIGEGINMALQSAVLLSHWLLRQPAGSLDRTLTYALNRRYAADWRVRFAPRLRFARAYAHAAMRPAVTLPVQALLRSWPSLLTQAARWAGKAQRST